MAFRSESVLAHLAATVARQNENFGQTAFVPSRVASPSRRPDLQDEDAHAANAGVSCKFFGGEVPEDDRPTRRGIMPRKGDLFNPAAAQALDRESERRARQHNRPSGYGPHSWSWS